MKYRSDTVGRPYISVYTRAYCSAASFETPYGLTGVIGCVSSYGRYSDFPYTDDELPTITRSVAESRAASSTFNVPPTLISLGFRGFSTLTRTPACAA